MAVDIYNKIGFILLKNKNICVNIQMDSKIMFKNGLQDRIDNIKSREIGKMLCELISTYIYDTMTTVKL